MSTVTSCTLFNSTPAVRLSNSYVGRFQSVASAATAPFSSPKRSCALSVCCAINSKGEHNPKTDLHPFNIPSVVLVNPVSSPREERWQLEEETGKVNLWFEVPGQTKDDLAVEIDEDVLVIKKRTNTLPTENMDQRNGGSGARRDPKIPGPGQQGIPTAKGLAPDGDVIYARLLLPAGYSKEGVEAELKSGVLRVSIAKIKEQARRKINVNIYVK
ncbi:hypothetical protein QOZ80_2AG0120250 [Eleusine coracana subsp. coracana]|nr:hypothetical protein QOZ80_2AG0120250 [Eleusine coracana subsp. coracana]